MLHWPASMGVHIPAKNAAGYLRAWQTLHMSAPRSWSDIAYSHAVDLDGNLYTLRGWDRVEGGAKNMGGKCVSILAIMGSLDTPTEAMKQTIVLWQNMADQHAGRKLTRTYHGKLIQTECPGPALTQWARNNYPLRDDETPAETDRLFTYAWANGRAERWGGLNDNSPKRAQELAKLKPSIIGVAEFSERARNATRAELGPEWLTWPVGYCAVLWSNKSWLHGGSAEIGFGTNYHGAVRVPLTSLRNNKHTMDVISVHVRPADSYPGQTDSYILKRKREQIERTLTELLRPGKPTIVGGDFNTTHAADIFTKHGLVLAVNHDIDQIWVTPDIGIRKGTVYDPGNISDHKWLMLQGTLRANTT